jgi:hypothetical protein
MASDDEDTGDNPPAVPEASPAQTAADAANFARVLAPLCRRAGLHTLATLFEMAEQEARGPAGKTVSAPQGEGVSWGPADPVVHQFECGSESWARSCAWSVAHK